MQAQTETNKVTGLLSYNPETGATALIRPALTSDLPLIYNSWCTSIRRREPFKAFNRDDFAEHKMMVIEPLVARAGALVACNPENKDQLFGWVCGEYTDDKQILHGVYVKDVFRGHGILDWLFEALFPLLDDEPVYVTHRIGPSVREVARRKWRLIYNPYLCRL